jgi:hypothetical protein
MRLRNQVLARSARTPEGPLPLWQLRRIQIQNRGPAIMSCDTSWRVIKIINCHSFNFDSTPSCTAGVQLARPNHRPASIPTFGRGSLISSVTPIAYTRLLFLPLELEISCTTSRLHLGEHRSLETSSYQQRIAIAARSYNRNRQPGAVGPAANCLRRTVVHEATENSHNVLGCAVDS